MDVNVDSQWDAGYCATVTVTNDGAESVLWKFTLEVDGEITHLECNPDSDRGRTPGSGSGLEPEPGTGQQRAIWFLRCPVMAVLASHRRGCDSLS